MTDPISTYTMLSQPVVTPLTSNAIFLTLDMAPTGAGTVADVLSDVDGLVKTVGFRLAAAALSVTVGIGAHAWSRLTDRPKPAQLHEFIALSGEGPVAPSTGGDLFFHIRAERADICFEFERLLLNALGDAVSTRDEVVGFRYFDARDLLGFVDGTANPVGVDAVDSAVITEPTDPYLGGSYLLVQRYVHDLSAWGRMTAHAQEMAIGRTKLDNVELPDATGPAQKSHKTLNTIVDDAGVEHDIIRDNMPFGRPGEGEFGTFFISYSADLSVTEKMLQRMFHGDPIGKYDPILNVSTATTGAVFFVPPRAALASLEAQG